MKTHSVLVKLLSDFIKKKFNPLNNSCVLYFHRVLDKKDPYFPDDITVDELDKLISNLKLVFDIVSLDKIHKKRSATGKPLLGLSFDDGYLDNITNGLPVLKKHNVPATFFIASEGVQSGLLWQDLIIESLRRTDDTNLDGMAYQGRVCEKVKISRDYQKEFKHKPLIERNRLVFDLMNKLNVNINSIPRLMMTIEDVKRLSEEPLFTIGAHTHNHVILTTEDDESSFEQIKGNKDLLEKWTGLEIDLFCYPNGATGKDFSEKHMQMVKDIGFKCAFSTTDGGIGRGTLDFSIPRFMPHRRQPLLLTLSALKISGE